MTKYLLVILDRSSMCGIDLIFVSGTMAGFVITSDLEQRVVVREVAENVPGVVTPAVDLVMTVGTVAAPVVETVTPAPGFKTIVIINTSKVDLAIKLHRNILYT